MFFAFWLILQVCYLTVLSLLVPSASDPAVAPATKGQWAIVGCYYFIGFSWLLAPAEPCAELFTLGFLLYACGAALAIYAMRSNPYFRAAIVPPPEVIRSGAYQYLSHPGYLGFILMGGGSVLMLGHALGFVPWATYAAILCRRAYLEEKILKS